MSGHRKWSEVQRSRESITRIPPGGFHPYLSYLLSQNLDKRALLGLYRAAYPGAKPSAAQNLSKDALMGALLTDWDLKNGQPYAGH